VAHTKGTTFHVDFNSHIFSHRGLDPEASMVSCCAAPFVKFMMDNMEKRGCKVQDKDFFVVRHCDEKVGGGFDESASKHGGVVLCQNHIRDFQHTGSHCRVWTPATTCARFTYYPQYVCSPAANPPPFVLNGDTTAIVIILIVVGAELTLTHELVHAYDHCRAYVDWSNCVHHACSEVRAANLSGDCRM
jgi:hypothetical protein